MSVPLSLNHASRKEDARLLSGQGAFTSDFVDNNTLRLVVVRSVHAHANLTRVDVSAARQAPGVRWVAAASDLQALDAQAIVNAVSVKNADGSDQVVVRMPILAQDKVHFVGQPIVFVVADTEWQALDAAELVVVDYQPLPAVSQVGDALAVQAPQLHQQATGNVSAHFASGDPQAVEQAMRSAKYVSRLTINSQRLMGVPMEPRTVMASHDASAQVTTVYSPSQGINGLLNFLASTTGLPAEQIRLHNNDVGGSFGLRVGAYSEHVGVIFASRQLERPVAWVGTRSESFLSDWHGRALSLEGEIALDEQGRFLAIRFNDKVDVGAYNVMMSSFIGTRNLSITMGGVYQVPALYMESRMVFTNTTPISAYRGAGRPDIAYAIERLVDFAAHEHGFDPVALRRRNFIPPSDFPYTTANGTLYDLCESERLMDRALQLADWDSFAQRQAQAKLKGRLRGLGFSTVLEASGAGGAPKDQVRANFDAQGCLVLYGVTGPSGQGHETSFAQIIESLLHWPRERVVYIASHPGQSLTGNGTGGSRSLYGAGSAIADLCQRIPQALSEAAAAALGAGAVTWQEGCWHSEAQPGQRLSLVDFIDALSPQARQQWDLLGEASSGVTYPNGCHVAEVEIDPLTGQSQLINYIAVDDLGCVISPQLVQGQVHGGVVQGWGQAFCEQVVYDEMGQLLTGSFMDYAIPRLGDVAQLTNETVEVRTHLNLLGSKGVGESGCTGSLPALANAVMSALRPFGIHEMDMPFTSQKIWQALQARKSDR